MERSFRFPAFLQPYTGLPGSIYILFFARIINAAGNFVFPFLTLFLTRKLGMGSAATGWFVMLATLVQAPGALLGGKLADHIGRKRVFVTAQMAAGLLLIPCAFISDQTVIPWLLIAAAACNGAVHPVNSALVADLTNLKNRREAFSLLYLGINIGTAVGPMVAGFLFNHYIKWLFLGDAATTIFATTLVIAGVKERTGRAEPEEDLPFDCGENPRDEQAESGSVFGVMFRRPVLTSFILLLTVFSFVYSQHSFTLPLQLNELFGSRGPEIFGVLMTVNALVVVVLTTLIIALTRNLKPIFNVALAGLFYAIGFGMLLVIKSYELFILSTVIWTIGEILSVTSTGVYIACHTPISHRGRVNSVQSLCQGTGSCLGPALMGGYIVHLGTRAVWPLLAGLAFGATLVMFCLGMLEQRRERKRSVKSEV